MKAVKVPKERGEEVRRLIEKLGLKDKRRRIRYEDGHVIIPVLDKFQNQIDGVEVFHDSNPVFVERKNFREILEGVAGFYPRFADIKLFGRVAIIKLPDSLLPYKDRIAMEIMRNYKVSAVWLDKGKLGMERKPRVELLAGRGSVVLHKENGCVFKFDVTKVMYSQGNQYEKIRIARLVEEGEIVLDMFAGIGYFTIPIAKHSKARRIISVEINPDSYEFLIENLKLNETRNVLPILGDSSKVSPSDFADRVLMGHLKAHHLIPKAIEAIRDEGWIHYHESVPVKILERPIKRLERTAESMGAKIIEIGMRKVKNYAPNVYHVVVDARIRKLSK